MRVIFIGDPVELERAEGLSRMSTTLYGVTFPMSAEVDISHLPLPLQQKVLRNPHFRAAGVDAPAVPLVFPVSAPAPDAPVDEDDAEAAEAAAHKARAAAKKAAKAAKVEA